MHSVQLLVNIAFALGYALLGGLVARRLGLPTIVGYLLAGVALGPFIVGQAGMTLGVLTQTQYSLILAGAIVSITLNPWMFRLIDPVERRLKRYPRLWARLNRQGPEIARPEEHLSGHVVIVGCGRVGRHIAEVLATSASRVWWSKPTRVA